MTVSDIVVKAQDKIKEMGGGEQFIGKTSVLSAACGVSKNKIFDWMIELGDALAEVNLNLLSGPGKPDDLYVRASPK